jgi:hypothetical protein
VVLLEYKHGDSAARGDLCGGQSGGSPSCDDDVCFQAYA